MLEKSGKFGFGGAGSNGMSSPLPQMTLVPSFFVAPDTSHPAITVKLDALHGNSTDNLYLFWKTNAGTANVDKIIINWQE